MQKYIFLCLLNLAFIVISSQSFSQSNNENIFACSYASSFKPTDLSNVLKDESFVSNETFEKLVDKILMQLGLPRNFIIVSYPQIENAYAFTDRDGIRYIVYDKVFITKINNASTKWSTLAILAHEMGHHLSGHTQKKPMNLEEQRAYEIDADTFSGFIMFKLGATIYQAQAVVNLLSSNNNDTFSSHPTLDKRKLAIERGFENAKNQDSFYKIDTNKSVEEYYNEASALIFSNEYFGAINNLKKAISLNPNYFKAFHDLGYAKSCVNDIFGAISAYDESIRINPNFDLSFNNRGSAKEKLKNYSGALEDYNSALKVNPNFAIGYSNRAFTKSFLGDFKGAIEDATKAIKLEPKYSNAYINRGIAKCGLKRFKDGILDFNEALKINPYSGMAYFNRGSAKGNLADLKGCCNDLSISCKLGFELACNAYIQYCH